MSFDDKSQKAFDFASETTKQQISIASAFLALTLGLTRVFYSDLSDCDLVLVGISWLFLFLSIAFGVLTFMALTHELQQDTPSIDEKPVRAAGTLQALFFGLGIVFTAVVGISSAT